MPSGWKSKNRGKLNMTWWREFEKFSEQLRREVLDAIGHLPEE
jgi:hypothetical protein